MRNLPKDHGRLAPGGAADFIIFKARRYSELLSRPQVDRVVVRKGKEINAHVPDYSELDFVPAAVRSGDVPVAEVTFQDVNGTVIMKTKVIGETPIVVNGGATASRERRRLQTGNEEGGALSPLPLASWALAAALLAVCLAVLAVRIGSSVTFL